MLICVYRDLDLEGILILGSLGQNNSIRLIPGTYELPSQGFLVYGMRHALSLMELVFHSVYFEAVVPS